MLYTILQPKNNRVFVQEVLQQLLYLVNEIYEAFENTRSLEVRAVFLDISKAFDNVWHEGLIFLTETKWYSWEVIYVTENNALSKMDNILLILK